MQAVSASFVNAEAEGMPERSTEAVWGPETSITNEDPQTSRERSLKAGRWIRADGSRLVQAEFPTGIGAVIALQFSDYDAPATSTLPI